MTQKVRKEYSFLKLYEKFLKASITGRRRMANGNRLSPGTILNYYYTYLLIKKFCINQGFYLRIRSVRLLNEEEIKKEKKYWDKFYILFTEELYKKGAFDNYVGINVKNIRTFFTYLNKELTMNFGEFHKGFYVHKELIAIYPLTPGQLNFLIYSVEFNNALSKRMKEVKDFFVFGCTVALRFSDLLSLTRSNLTTINGEYYLRCISQKSKIETCLKLPEHALSIISRYNYKKFLLPRFNIVNLNKFIKRLLRFAGFTDIVTVIRFRRGIPESIEANRKNLRFCDVATTHTMRRTAITTMLALGVPEQIVRNVSGHAPGSKEFYRYVKWAQAYQDKEMEKMFFRLEESQSR